ncbi:hypothetical protein [Hyphomicrobium sp.]|uniref:hypothetical protein n=1 Tax=Hyphomicrobium sp. TaxID=82 RepID=UPI003F729965
MIERVELQRAGEGHPLDDVIIRGATRAGEPVVLEVQVKRTITFAPGDAVFKSVVEQLAKAFPTLDLSNERHQFAVATERTSFKITGPYQDVLRWARQIDSPSIFFARINRKNVGNVDMRTFVETVRTHLEAAGCPHDDETVWQLLRRFHILTFDYDVPGSQSVELALERARNLLDPADGPRASAFWKVLTETAIRVAAAGGDLDRVRLLDEITVVDSFRLLGLLENRAVLDTLAEAATLAAADLRGSIAGATLARTAQLDAVREARDRARYIEIRGGSGVGKSGLLGLLVDQVLSEGRAIVLSPERTIPGGWVAFKTALEIAVGPEAFLSELASDGGAVLFIDSLDFFANADKRATVIDLVRAAVSVPNFQVIVTARTDFDKDEPNWLPGDVLAKLGRTPPILVDELGVEEVEELKAAAPGLRALLADDHPARAMARNLFRLSRLVEIEGSARQLRSEVDLLERWWTTADGPPDGRRERARLIASLTDAILAGSDHLTTTSSAIDALIASGTLRELGLDHIAFRHDVLRDWGVAARLHDDPSKIVQLPLNCPVPPSLARGIELGARFALERSEDGRAWIDYVSRLSPSGAHASWRRWPLLAILRSELALALLDRAAEALFENNGTLLRELIRTAIAVESRPLAEMLASLGAHTASIPAGMFGPANGSWANLVQWLVARRADLPLRALPDVVELFQSFSASTFVLAPISPHIAGALADWLEEIEDAQEHSPLAADRLRFQDAFRYHELHRLGTDARQAFLLTASRVPERAKGYLRKLLSRRNPDQTIREIMRFRGTLAQAAPAELVELTLAGLIPRNDKRRRRVTGNRDETFSYADSNFLPSSPGQGPFLDLLNAAPEQGLTLIRRLVGHAITARTNGRDPNDDSFTLALPTGTRSFPWQRSYFWSRQADGAYAVECALLALEAWSHVRIERGDAPEQVITDILGLEGSSAAFLLVAVDVMISHWPKTKTEALPFLGSPDLLSLDRSRQVHDAMPAVDLGVWGLTGPKEPTGPVQLADLKKRASRRFALESLLGLLAFDTSADRITLHTLLAEATTRLGPPLQTDTFAEPRLMARYALNLIDPANWHPREGGYAYVSPPDEAQHITALQAKQAPRTLDFGIDAAIQNALEESARSNPGLAEQAVAYAQRQETATDTSEDVLHSRTNAIVSAAMILIRDGPDATFDQHETWARAVFTQALTDRHDAFGAYLSDGIRFNPVAIATLGLVHLLRRRRRDTDRDTLFELAGRDGPEAAQGFGAGFAVIRDIDPRLLPSLLRCALAAQIQPTHDWDDTDEKKEAKRAEHRTRVARAIAAELAWLNGSAPEPSWPAFPAPMIAIRHGVRIGGGDEHDELPTPPPRPVEQLRSQAAALWVRQLSRGDDPVDLKRILSFVDAYAQWTAAANGAGLDLHVELDGRTDEWNTVFFRLLGRALPHMEPVKAVEYVTQAITVPDEAFFDLSDELIRAIDTAHFNDAGLDLDVALSLRTLVADRLVKTSGWRRERDRTELSVESHIGPAIAALFFNEYAAFNGASCYLLPKGTDRVAPFLPGLTRLIEEGSVPFTALLTMNLLDVSPRQEHASFLISSASTWLRRQPTNTALWVDGGLGARLAKWLEEIFNADVELCSSFHPLRSQMDEVLARLVQAGVAEAHRVENRVATTVGP